MSTPTRALGLFSVLCIGVNAIVGSGIYRLPGRLGHYLGPASWLAFALVGLMLVAVALCFAEAAGMFSGTGGPYLYAREAFGTVPGFLVGWSAWVTMVLSFAAVANAVPGYLASLAPSLDGPKMPAVTIATIALGLGIVNLLGVKPGALTTNVFTAAKVVPLAVFVALGLFAVSGDNLGLVPRPAVVPAQLGGAASAAAAPMPLAGALGAALFAALFPCQGFEVAPVPAGETKEPTRNVPIAVIGALLASVAFYVLIQIVAYGTAPSIATSGATPDKPWSTRPIVEAAATFMGTGGARFMAAGACVSMVGFCAGSALVTPRFLVALGQDGLLPRALAHHGRRFESPHVAIVTTSVAVLVAALALDFDALVDLSNVAVIAQYALTCAAITWLRRTRPELPRRYRVPGGRWLVPLVGVGVCALLASQAKVSELAMSLVMMAAGGVFALAYRAFRPRATPVRTDLPS